MQEKFKKNSFRIIFGFLFCVPLILQLNPWNLSTWLKRLVRIGTPRDWLGFWSSYLGSILTVAFSYSIAKYETKKQKEISQKQWKHDNEIRLLETMVEFRDLLADRKKVNYKLDDLINDYHNRSNNKLKLDEKNLEKTVGLINDIQQCKLDSLKYYFTINSLNKDVGKDIFVKLGNISSIIESCRDSSEKISMRDIKMNGKMIHTYYANIESLSEAFDDLYSYINAWLFKNKLDF